MSDIPPEIARLSFEEAMAELERIVRALEDGKGRLEESVQSYERGVALKRHCERKLAEAQAVIERITLGPDGTPGTAPFD